jgi:regulator of replication initiation timing
MSAHAIDVEPIDRLAEKVKGLISILERIRGELSQTVDENLRLSRDVEHLKSQLAKFETKGADLSSLLEEREQIRTRVSEMLEQLESISA